MGHGAPYQLNPYLAKVFGASKNGVLRRGRIGTCFFCLKKQEMTFDVGAMSPAYRACQRCIENRGLDALRNGADEAVQALAARRRSPQACVRCGSALIQSARPKDRVFICRNCLGKLPQVAKAARKLLRTGSVT